MSKSGKLVGFLGKGPPGGYSETHYEFQSETSRRTRFVILALAELVDIQRVILFATKDSYDYYAKELTSEAIAHKVKLEFRDFPLGQSQEELQQQIAVLVPELLDPTADPLYLDITHGFRSFPFFASSLMAFASSLNSNITSFHVVYGAFEAAATGQPCPIWDLSPTLGAYQQGFALSTFLRSGRLDPELSGTIKAVGARLRSQDPSSARNLAALGRALQHFADDFATIRIGPMLLGKNERDLGSAVALRNALHQSRPAVKKYFPMLDPVVNDIETMIAPLTHHHSIPHLATPRGLRCSLELAKLYESCERYSECAVVLREMSLDLYASPAAASPGYTTFNSRQRSEAQAKQRKRDSSFLAKLKSVRDDIEHGGYDDAAHMKDPKTIRQKLQELREEMEVRVKRKEREVVNS